MTSSTTLIFPHPELTKIIGRPTSEAIQQIRKELYANAREIHCSETGGNVGHLGVIMPPEDYNNRTGIPFPNIVHPGAAPTIAAFANHNTFIQVSAALKAQLLASIDNTYLRQLEDMTFGFGDVTAQTMLAHLTVNYGRVKDRDLEVTRKELATAWNPDTPLENVWTRISKAQQLTVVAGEPITDRAAIALTITAFEQSGVFEKAIDDWLDKDEADKSAESFHNHFTAANNRRLEKLTARTAGFHGANNAIIDDVTTQMAAANLSNTTPPPPTPPPAVNAVVGGVPMFYCWTHGLGFNSNHTSRTCERRAEGHREDATVKDLKGGNNTLVPRRGRPNPN